MDIVKNLKDYKLSTQQKIFINVLRERINSYSCSEKVRNPEFLRHYYAPANDFVVYATGVADPKLLLRRAV